MTGRKNAMLTTEDRRWLKGEKEYEGKHAKQQRYQRRRDIRERVYNSILDFPILFDQLDANERDKLFDRDGLSDDRFEDGLRDALAFILYNTGITNAMRPRGVERRTPAESLLHAGLTRAARRDGIIIEEMDLQLETRSGAVDDVIAAVRAGEEITAEELVLLVESGVIDRIRLQGCLRDLLTDWSTPEVNDEH